MYRLARATLLLAALPAASLAFQSRSIPRDIVGAEAEGAAYRRLAADGVPPRTCVNALGAGLSRSGEFTIAGMLSARAGEQAKISWTPVNRGKDLPPLELRGRNLSRPRETLRYSRAEVALSGAG